MTRLSSPLDLPLLTALALCHRTSAQGIVFLGLLPLATALLAVIRAGEQPRPSFWTLTLAGAVLVAGYARRGSMGSTLVGDRLMVAAVLVFAA